MHLASELVTEALAATRAKWPDPPRIGAWFQTARTPHATLVQRGDLAMITFVNESRVRAKRDAGRCFLRAGFERVGRTAGGLLALGIRADRLPPPEAPLEETADLFSLLGPPKP